MNKLSKLIVAVSIFLLLSFSLLFVTFSESRQVPFLTQIVNAIVRPVQSVLSKPTNYFSEQKDVLSDLMDAYKENKELKAILSGLEDYATENITLKAENESLRSSLGIASNFSEKQYVAGLVLVRTPASWSEHLTIDIGGDQGVIENALVVANGGLIGVISHVDPDSANVKLLTNSDEFTKLPVKISLGSKEIYGILSGYDADSNSFVINQLNGSDDIPVGSNVVTSDLAGAAPANIKIGRVLSVKSNSNNLNREIYVEPTASFSNLYSVLVVRQDK